MECGMKHIRMRCRRVGMDCFYAAYCSYADYCTVRDCAEWQYTRTSECCLCLIIPNLLWIIGECQGYAVYLIRTVEKGIVLALAQYLQTTVATRPTPPAAFVFWIF